MDATPSTAALVRHIQNESIRSAELVDELNRHINETNARIDTLREELGRKIIDSGMRTAAAVADLTVVVKQLVTILKNERT